MSGENGNQKGARQRILTAAAQVFAEKSFDGARVDEIAKMAQVPKSLIYYHFKSKDEIFAVLIQEFLEEYRTIIQTYQEESCRTDTGLMKERMEKEYFQFGIANENLVRAILMDSIKKGKSNTALFQMMELLGNQEEDGGHLVKEFLFNIMPCMAYICFKEEWNQYFQMDADVFDQAFLEMYVDSHSQYHMQRKNEKEEEK